MHRKKDYYHLCLNAQVKTQCLEEDLKRKQETAKSSGGSENLELSYIFNVKWPQVEWFT